MPGQVLDKCTACLRSFAAANACKSKGFKDGQPLDVRTAEKCNASLWVSGQPSAPAECPIETVVLRAACQ